jgi:integrase
MSAGHIRPRGPGAWELKYDIGRDAKTGKRITKYATVRGTKRDAQRELRRLLGEVDRGVVADAGKMTVGQWLEQWLAECKHTVAPKTWQERAAYVRLHLDPALGATLLAKLTPAHIQAYYSDALTGGRLDGKGGLSPQTVRHHDRVLHTALDRARKLRLIATNPVDDVEPPRVERAPMVTLTGEQQAALLAAASGTDLYVPVFVALTTGLRRGETLGLAWSNVDLEARRLRVVQTVEETKAGARLKPQPKTTHGRRTVALTDSTIDVLRRHRVAQAEEHLKLGLGKPTLLFPRWAASPAVFGTAFTRMAARIGIAVSIHDLRHTHITDLLAAGVHPKVVSERAGHSSVAFTLDRYAHTTPAMHQAAAEQIDAVLRQALGGKRVANDGAAPAKN